MSTKNTYTIEDQFKYKKDSCLARGIDWNFTLAEFKILWGLRTTTTCFYTGKTFNLVKNKGKLPRDYPTMERLAQNSPYCPEAVVWVTHESNQLKAQFIEQGHNRNNQSPIILGILNKIEKVLNNPKTLEAKLAFYREAYQVTETEELPDVLEDKPLSLAQQNIANIKLDKEEKEMGKKSTKTKKNQATLLMDKMNGKNKVVDKEVVKEKPDTVVEKIVATSPQRKPRLNAVLDVKLGNPEIALAKQYSETGALLEGAGATFSLTFNQFKLLMAKNSCSLTGRKFVDDDIKTLFLKDKSLPYQKGNVLLTSITIQRAIDNMLLAVKLSAMEIKKLGDVLGK